MSDFIVPLGSLPSIGSIGSIGTGDTTATGGTDGTSNIPFSEILQQAMGDMIGTNSTSEESMYGLALGGDDDLHTGAIASVKASTSINYTSGLVSSAVKAYQELMRISL